MTDYQLPQHEHGCDHCHFLGRHTFEGPLNDGTAKRFDSDLYYCPGTGTYEDAMGGSLVARHSSAPSDYTSHLLITVIAREESMRAEPATITPAILEALDRYRASVKEQE